MNKKARWYTSFIHKVLLAAAVAAVLGGCGKKNGAEQETTAPEPSALSIELETEKSPQPVKILTIGEEPVPVLPDLPVLDENPVPEYLRNGVEHPIVASLQQRLMDLGFMDNDEPTQYFWNDDRVCGQDISKTESSGAGRNCGPGDAECNYDSFRQILCGFKGCRRR